MNKNQKLKVKRQKAGFTLIELLVVISIIGVLASLLMANISGIRERSRDSRRKSDLKELKTALMMYHNDCDNYPPDKSDGNEIQGCGTCIAPDDCGWGNEFANAGGTIYMKRLPIDPINDGSYFYHYDWVDRDNFRLRATLENLSDKEAEGSQVACLGSAESPATTNFYVCAD
ncbi:MAG: Type II secretion system protein G precursor [Microgenomates group bacterium ADurb.Bin219]|nr:MAG: Type II secretion system protein G precursor [Microgenomates group bacterium ADurb.Bin219]HNP89487.1 prepilin-type N-terminal cleavage/methylation domain-containing protein [Candidatus Woesebacteria bacterium]